MKYFIVWPVKASNKRVKWHQVTHLNRERDQEDLSWHNDNE